MARSFNGIPEPFQQVYDPSPVEMTIGDLGIPSEIVVKMPPLEDIKVLHDIPDVIRVEGFQMQDIRILPPETPLPSVITIDAASVPSSIELKAVDLPSAIKLDASGLPSTIMLEIPEAMRTIKIDASGIPDKIQVIGIPSVIELIGAPSQIQLVMPENPEIELVYRGAPIDVKINLDMSKLTGEDGKGQCVAIVPCNPG
jgi:hypothetical protein